MMEQGAGSQESTETSTNNNNGGATEWKLVFSALNIILAILFTLVYIIATIAILAWVLVHSEM